MAGGAAGAMMRGDVRVAMTCGTAAARTAARTVAMTCGPTGRPAARPAARAVAMTHGPAARQVARLAARHGTALRSLLLFALLLLLICERDVQQRQKYVLLLHQYFQLTIFHLRCAPAMVDAFFGVVLWG